MKAERVAELGGRPLAHLGGDALFVVWGPPSHGPRSRVFARELGIDVRFVASFQRRGALTAPIRYASQAIKTMGMLLRLRPRLVFVQSPPSFAVAAVRLYAGLAGADYIVDAHSAAMQSPVWTRPRALSRALARRAAATIVTNEHFAHTVRAWGGRALVVRDIPTTFPEVEPVDLPDGFNLMVVSTFAPDEPLGEVIAAARGLEGVRFHVTGDPRRAGDRLRTRVPANVRYTGFLPDPAYYGLMSASHAVMCLTTRDDTMQRGACEALSMGKPIITSDRPLLRDYFHRGTVHVDSSAVAIRAGVEEMVRHHVRYATEIEQLQEEQHREWRSAVEELTEIVDGCLGRRTRATRSEGKD
jgi:glycosyltransferase involved in cell wall biosynthesis